MADNHVPLRYAKGLVALREQRQMRTIIVNPGEEITEEVISRYEGDASGFTVIVRPQPNIAKIVKANTEAYEEDQLAALDSQAEVVGPGEFLFEEGDNTYEIYILLRGTVSVIKDGEDIAAISKSGAFLGEMASVRNKPRSATIKTMSDCRFYSFDGKRVIESARQNPIVLTRLCKSLAEKLAKIDTEYAAIAPLDIDGQIQSDKRIEKKDLPHEPEGRRQAKQVKRFEKGEVLFEQGEHSMDIFIMLEGAVKVIIDDREVASVNQNGTIIGEMSGLLARPRNATVITEARSTFCIIPAGSLMHVAQTQPGILYKMCCGLADRLAYTSEEFLKLRRSSGTGTLADGTDDDTNYDDIF